MQHLENCSFDQQAAADIVELHGHVTRAISHRTAGVFLASFVSKYLHFHCPIVPIYDSYAQATIGKLVDWDLVGPIRDALSTLPEWARAYRNFVAAFVVLYQRACTETPLKPTVKELDHLLWQSERAACPANSAPRHSNATIRRRDELSSGVSSTQNASAQHRRPQTAGSRSFLPRFLPK